MLTNKLASDALNFQGKMHKHNAVLDDHKLCIESDVTKHIDVLLWEEKIIIKLAVVCLFFSKKTFLNCFKTL